MNDTLAHLEEHETRERRVARTVKRFAGEESAENVNSGGSKRLCATREADRCRTETLGAGSDHANPKAQGADREKRQHEQERRVERCCAGGR